MLILLGRVSVAFWFLALILLLPFKVEAQLSDRNGDDELRILFFGDSLTFGVGDGLLPSEFVEVGPGAVLRGLLKRIDRKFPASGVN